MKARINPNSEKAFGVFTIDADELRAMFPRLSVETGRGWIDEGRVVTSAGISAGVDMSLYLISKLETEELALRTARQMDYRWNRVDKDDAR